jgi:hypothetical protein
MKASETKLREIIEGTKQYTVPLFQRAYKLISKISKAKSQQKKR